VLQVAEGDAAHQRVPMQAGPGSSLEGAEAEFLFELLVGLFANPARLDRRREIAQRDARVRRTPALKLADDGGPTKGPADGVENVGIAREGTAATCR